MLPTPTERAVGRLQHAACIVGHPFATRAPPPRRLAAPLQVPGTSGFSAAAMRTTLKTFVEGPTLVLHHAVPLLEKAVAVRGGTASVVNISSNAAQRHGAAVPVYSAAKAALDSLTKSAAASLGPKGVRVNAVAPGPVFTNVLIASGLTQEQSDAFFNAYGSKAPLGRAGKPQEIANVVSSVPWLVGREDRVPVCATWSTVSRPLWRPLPSGQFHCRSSLYSPTRR